MTAMEQGMRDAREYAIRFHPKTMTIEQFCTIGRLAAKERYTRKKAQDEYAYAWYVHAAIKFPSLFKPDDHDTFTADAYIDDIQRFFRQAQERIIQLQNWRKDDPTIAAHLSYAYDQLFDAMNDIAIIADHIKHPEEL